MKFSYQAYDNTGRSISDVIEAASKSEAMEQLRLQGLYITEIVTGIAGKKSGHQARRSRLVSNRLKNLAMFTRQLYVLASTGTPMVESLGALERQTKDLAWKKVIGDLRRRVEEGVTISEAMSDHPECFDSVYRSLVAAGESSGKFQEIMDRLAMLVKRQLQTRNTIAGALVYPILLLVVASVVLIAMLLFVLPRFAELFSSLDVPLPATTEILIIMSSMLKQMWWAVLGGLFLTVIVINWYVGTASGRQLLDTVMLRLPYFGTVVRSFITARISRLLGTLMQSHIPLLDALALTREAAGNVHYRQLMNNAEQVVEKGEPISLAFADENLITPTVYEAIRSGEATGQVGPLLLNLADFMDDENEVVLRSLTSILEPIILIGMGVLVALVALSMFLPLFDLAAQAGGA